MIRQNIYTITDTVHCPEGNGEPVRRYLGEAFNRIASQVVAVELPVDWLVVKSSSLDAVINGSRNFYCERFEEALQSVADSRKKITVVKDHGVVQGGAISQKNILEWIGEKLGQDFEPHYLNELDLRFSFVGYHLDMR